MNKEPTRSLGKYALETCLGRGGMAEVWRAFDPHLRRHVAIKFIRSERSQDPDFLVRFEREAKLIASLNHPNIVKIHDFQVTQLPEALTPTAYMVMDYVKGQTLSDYIRATSGKGNIPTWEDIIYLFSAISRALDYAHHKGMLHRDIKPANILLDQRSPSARGMGEPILTDFGVARMQDVQTGTIVGSLIGTPLYMAPEQALGQHTNKYSDLYSLGIILYEITTGVTPFRGNSTITTIMQHVNAPATPPELLNTRISAPVSAVILRSIAKRPEDRYPSAIDMTLALARALNIPTPGLQHLYGASARTNERNTPPPEAMPGVPNFPNTLQSGPLPFTQQHTHPKAVTPAYFLHGTNASLTPQPAHISPLISTPQPPLQTRILPPDNKPPWFKRLGKRSLLLSILLLVIVIAGGLSIAIFQQPTPTPTNTITGQIVFTRSPHATGNNYDQILIDINNVPPPPQGSVYYAWLYSNVETSQAHWQLTYNNGNLHLDNQSYPGYANLLITNTTFLITREDADNAPVVPYPDPSARLYYAQITTSALTSFTIKPCSANSTLAACL